MVENFVGRVVKFEIDGQEYKLKSPPAKFIPKLMALQSREPSSWTDKEWEGLIDLISAAVKKTYPEWSEESIDDFVVQNMVILQEKLVLAMGWATEEQIEKSKGAVKEAKTKESFLEKEKQ